MVDGRTVEGLGRSLGAGTAGNQLVRGGGRGPVRRPEAGRGTASWSGGDDRPVASAGRRRHDQLAMGESAASRTVRGSGGEDADGRRS